MNSKINILIISYSYPPDNAPGAQRPYALAKYLNKEKYNVKAIICANPDLTLGENKDFDPALDGVELIKIKSRIGNSASILRPKANLEIKKINTLSKSKTFLFKTGQQLIFPDKGILWTPSVKTYLKQNKELIDNTDIVFSTSPGVTNHQIAQYICKRNKKIRWMADFRDFNYVENWSEKKGIKSFLHKRMETSFVKEATALTFVTKTMQQAYQKFYPTYHDKMYCAYNGFEKTNLTVKNNSSNEENKISIFYAGSFYNGLRSPFPLLQLLDKAFEDNLLNATEVQIQIAGNLDAEMKEEMKTYTSYSCVDFLGTLPRAEVLKKMSEATFLWLIVANIKSHYQTIPIKLFEYISARRPIVSFAPSQSESSQIIKESKLGYNFNTLEFNLEESYPILKILISDIEHGRYKEPLSDVSLETYSWEKQIEKIENLL